MNKIASLPNMLANFHHFGSRLHERYGLFILFEEYAVLRNSFRQVIVKPRVNHKPAKIGYVTFKKKQILVIIHGTGKGTRLITALPYQKYPLKMNEQLSIKTISLFDSSKAERLAVANNILSAIDDGTVDIMKMHCYLKAMGEIQTILTDRSDKNPNRHLADSYMNSLIETANTYGGKSFDLHNAKFTKTEVGVKYDYAQSNDPAYTELSEELEMLKKKVKEREDFLKNLPESGLEQVDNETGETYTIYRPSKSSTSTVTVSLK